MPPLDDLIERLPHKPPMLMISAVLEASPSRVVAVARVSERLCQLFGDGERADAYCVIESLAQAAALSRGCYDSEPTPQQGMLVQVGRFDTSHATFERGAELRLEVDVDVGLGGSFAMASGRAMLDGTEVCSAKLSIAIGNGSLDS